MFAHSLRHRLLIFLFLLAGLLAMDVGVRPASAQRPDSSAKEVTTRRDTPTAPRVGRKSPKRALFYSLGATVLPTAAGMNVGDAGAGVVLVLLGAGLGPSIGHLYAGNNDQALVGIGLRVGGGALGTLGFASALNASLEGQDAGGSGALFLVGGLTVLISGVYDIFTADNAAREYNEAHGLNAQMTPTVGPRGEQAGLALRVSF